MKNKKAQIGMIVTVAIAVIVGLILFQAIAANVEQGTRANTGVVTVNNATYTGTAVNVAVEMVGQELVGTPTITNRTSNPQMPAGNYTIAECVRKSDNLKGICYTPVDSAYATTAVNITYTYYPNGYIDDAGSRSITGIIVLLAAIGIALVVLAGSKFDF